MIPPLSMMVQLLSLCPSLSRSNLVQSTSQITPLILKSSSSLLAIRKSENISITVVSLPTYRMQCSSSSAARSLPILKCRLGKLQVQKLLISLLINGPTLCSLQISFFVDSSDSDSQPELQKVQGLFSPKF